LAILSGRYGWKLFLSKAFGLNQRIYTTLSTPQLHLQNSTFYYLYTNKHFFFASSASLWWNNTAAKAPSSLRSHKAQFIIH